MPGKADGGQRLDDKLTEIEVSLGRKIDGVGDSVIRHLDKCIEVAAGRRVAGILGVTSDEISLNIEKTTDHEQRIVKLEQRSGVR